MWKKFSLKMRIIVILCFLFIVTLSGGSTAIWYVWQMNNLFHTVIEQNIIVLRSSEKMRNALLMQKGFVSYFNIDGNPEWLKQLEQYHREFKSWLIKTRNLTLNDKQRKFLNEIEYKYIEYTFLRNKVINFYKIGKKQIGTNLHNNLRCEFQEIYKLCGEFKADHEKGIERAGIESSKRAYSIYLIIFFVTVGVLILGLVLAYILLHQILEPIKKLATGEEFKKGSDDRVGNEVKALSQRVYNLIEDVDNTKNRLEQSHEHLIQFEKWVMIGKLSAGMAHSIRNPLTSIKMRLYSLSRSVKFSEVEKEDFEVIYEEIRHLDTIVQNFLEFSRPPKLKMEKMSLSDIVDISLKLLRHRIKSFGVDVNINRQDRLPEIWLDPEQIKEVMVNLLLNACDAMTDGGVISIQEQMKTGPSGKKVVELRITDTGYGMSQTIQEKIFQPFFSTKEDGTGLGLSIARRIIEGHGGQIVVYSKEGEGTTFIITLLNG